MSRLPAEDAVRLLLRLAPDELTEGEARDVADKCDCNPCALRVVAGVLSAGFTSVEVGAVVPPCHTHTHAIPVSHQFTQMVMASPLMNMQEGPQVPSLPLTLATNPCHKRAASIP